MDMTRRAKIKDMVMTYAHAAHFDDEKEIDKLVDELEPLSDEEVITRSVVIIGRFADTGRISREDVVDNVDKLLAIAPDKFKNVEDLIGLFKDLKRKNMIHAATSNEENHRLVMETFDKFNEMLDGQYLDCYYTGGLMGYIITGTPLERYHGDLDILINEEELETLKKIVESNPDFTFESHMEGKEEHGHEFAIRYKNSPMTIGLFLFTRERDGTMVNKSYYYDRDSHDMMCIEEVHDAEFSSKAFETTERMHNGKPYKIMSLEYMYALKSTSYRDKDLYDAKLIEPHVNLDEAKEMIKKKNPVYEERVIVGSGVVKDIASELEMKKKK